MNVQCLVTALPFTTIKYPRADNKSVAEPPRSIVFSPLRAPGGAVGGSRNAERCQISGPAQAERVGLQGVRGRSNSQHRDVTRYGRHDRGRMGGARPNAGGMPDVREVPAHGSQIVDAPEPHGQAASACAAPSFESRRRSAIAERVSGVMSMNPRLRAAR